MYLSIVQVRTPVYVNIEKKQIESKVSIIKFVWKIQTEFGVENIPVHLNAGHLDETLPVCSYWKRIK